MNHKSYNDTNVEQLSVLFVYISHTNVKIMLLPQQPKNSATPETAWSFIDSDQRLISKGISQNVLHQVWEHGILIPIIFIILNSELFLPL